MIQVENELLAETWFLKIIVSQWWYRLSRCLKHSQEAAWAQPFNCLSNFMACIPEIRVSTFGSLKNQRFCALHFFKPNYTGMLETCNAVETHEWHWRYYSLCLWSDSSWPLQCLHRTFHHKKSLEETTLDPLACSIKKNCKRLSLLQRENFPNQCVQDMIWAWDNKLLQCSASWEFLPIWGDYFPDRSTTFTIFALTIALPIVDFLSLHFTKLINNIHGRKFG